MSPDPTVRNFRSQVFVIAEIQRIQTCKKILGIYRLKLAVRKWGISAPLHPNVYLDIKN